MGASGEKPRVFVDAVERFAETHSMFPAGASVVVGVSGGADSVAMLGAMVELSRRGRDLGLTVAHLDHRLRADSKADAAFVGELAGRWDLPCIVGDRDVAAEARTSGEGIEQAARTVRYEFLAEVAAKVKAARVAVGHNADDNVETILYRIVRGTHIRGLGGIPPVRALRGCDAMLVRPLLGCWRKDIELYCRSSGLTWRTDTSNLDVSYRRNFIRHELLPLLRERVNLRTDEALLRLAAAAAQVEQLIEPLAADALMRSRARTPVPQAGQITLDCSLLAAEPAAVRTYALRAAMEAAGVPMRSVGAQRFDELDRLLTGEADGAVSLSGSFEARRRGGQLILQRSCEDTPPPGEVVELACPGRTALSDGREVICELIAMDGGAFAAHCKSPRGRREWLDAAQIRGSLICRPRRDGDVFRPLGSPGTQSVSDFLTNAKLPRPRRPRVRCICDELGIVYLAPLRIDERVKITGRTRRVLRMTIESD
ncbi:MAG: tRNA lysidine(34) synthetase TilS [Phycisphaerae bacterium]|nr:tRNA lysidine(34) synthetase TilS [Phycisphaerae bacterium]